MKVANALFGRTTASEEAEHEWVTRWLQGRHLTSAYSPRIGLWPEFGLFVWRRPRLAVMLR